MGCGTGAGGVEHGQGVWNMGGGLAGGVWNRGRVCGTWEVGVEHEWWTGRWGVEQGQGVWNMGSGCGT